MAEVKGSGDAGMRENPPVQSKGMKFHGTPHKPGSVSHPGDVAPISGESSGHMHPRHVAYPKEKHLVSKVAPPVNDHDGDEP
jgi:hypothetical protein